MPLPKGRLIAVWQVKMAKYLVDSNVVLRFLLADDEIQSPIARSYFFDTNNLLIILPVVFCEVVWVMKKRSKIPNTKIAFLLKSLVANQRVIYEQTSFEHGIQFVENGGDFADGMIAFQAQNYDATLLTFDKTAQKVAKKLDILVKNP